MVIKNSNDDGLLLYSFNNKLIFHYFGNIFLYIAHYWNALTLPHQAKIFFFSQHI